MQFDFFWFGPALRYSCSSPCKATAHCWLHRGLPLLSSIPQVAQAWPGRASLLTSAGPGPPSAPKWPWRQHHSHTGGVSSSYRLFFPRWHVSLFSNRQVSLLDHTYK